MLSLASAARQHRTRPPRLSRQSVRKLMASTTARRAAKTVVFGGLVTGTGALGCWQTQRYFWKTELLEERRRALGEEPEDLPSGATSTSLAADRPDLCRNRRVRMAGAFDASRTAKIGPRSAPPGVMPRATGMGTGPCSGRELASRRLRDARSSGRIAAPPRRATWIFRGEANARRRDIERKSSLDGVGP